VYTGCTYLEKYPDGEFKALAEIPLKELVMPHRLA
jgi:hypothetical protein